MKFLPQSHRNTEKFKETAYQGLESENLLEQIFDFLIRDYSNFALQMILNQNNLPAQEEIYHRMIKKPAQNQSNFKQVWQQVINLEDCYQTRNAES